MIPTSDANRSRQAVGADAAGLLLYGVSFIGLMGFLFGVTSLLGLFLAETAFASHHLFSASDARDQVSSYLAALIVATPLWLGFWRLANRRVARSPEAHNAPERRLFFALTFAVTSIVALVAVHTLLRVFFTLPGAHDDTGALRDGISAGIRLLVYASACLYYTRLAWAERPTTQRDSPRDLALQLLQGLSLIFLSIGVINALALVVDQLLNLHGGFLLGSTPNSAEAKWGETAAWIVSGGIVWGAVSYVERGYSRVRAWRVPYVYIVLAVAVAVTLSFGGDLIYELVRRLFGYHTDNTWTFVHDALPPFLLGAALWAYHWVVLRHQADLDEASTSDGVIPWPRRPYIAALSFVGLASAATGIVTLLWVVIDLILKKHGVSDSGWWRDETSTGIAFLIVGALVWLRPWSVLQHGAAVDGRERAAETRRWLLGAIVLIATLAGIGYTSAFLWLILRMVLGGPHDADTIDNVFRYLATASVATGIAAYHGVIFRRDRRTGAGRTARLRVVALIIPGAEGAVAELSRRIGHRIEVIGYLAGGESIAEFNLQHLEDQLTATADARIPRALLILDSDGGTVYLYSRGLPAALPTTNASSDAQPVPSAP